jgi:hypothetical protein
MFSTTEVEYSPTVRGKPGELEALYRLWPPIKPLIAPTIILPSLPTRDLIKKRPLSKKEAPQAYAKRIASTWKTFPFFLEARFLKFDIEANEDAACLSRLLVLLEKFDCKAIPTIDIRTKDSRLKACAEYVARTGSGVAFRCPLEDIGRPGIEDKILTSLKFVDAKLAETALIIDLSEAAMIGIPEVAALMIHSYSKFAEMGSWAKTIVAASNYPEANPSKPNQHAVVQRLELAAWKEACRLDDRIKRNLTFGDFGADHGKVAFGDSHGPAITHLRYATPENWLITRGGPSSSKVDGSIRFAAARIINSDYFAGERFSWGDEFIFDCSSGAGRPGYPTVWRAVNMNHHMTRALVDVRTHLGRVVQQPAERQTPLQEVLQF